MLFFEDQLIHSPMNYTGGKYKILKDIFPYFPNDIHTFVDLFVGGLNVGINVKAQKVIANDQLTYIIDLYKYFQSESWNNLEKKINLRIEELGLSDVNQDAYLNLREQYNRTHDSLDFFLLICYSFNHQIRFNSKYEFNTPFGRNRSSYNISIQQNLHRFIECLHYKKFEFYNVDFCSVNLKNLTPNDYVYCDPPYLISTGSYNDGKRGFKDWTKVEERLLLSLLSDLDSRGIPFGLSNVIEHKGEKNEILIDWAQKYNLYYINKKYSNCSYHFKDRNTKTVEVFITNVKSQEAICQQPQLF